MINFADIAEDIETPESVDGTLEAQSLFQKRSGPGNYVPTEEECRPVAVAGTASTRTDGYAALVGVDGPAVLLGMLDEGINSGRITMHKWQAEILDLFQDPGFKPTQLNPLEFCLCACNGSGKDAFVIAPLVVWFALTKVRARVIITSSSGAQLESQTENYIRSLAENMNKLLGVPVFRIRQRYIRCNLSGSEIRLFATDEPGKAEGYHPLEADAEMMIVVNEAKSIDEPIFEALTRCTGFNYWLEVSSPGEPKGHFFNSFNNWEFKKRVQAFDCPHLGERHIERNRIAYGEAHPVYRSMILAEFTSVDGQVVVSLESYNRLINKLVVPNLKLPGEYVDRIGIDFACGGDGDSTYMVKCSNNTLVDVYRIKSSDIEEQIQEMHRKLNEWQARKARITMDDKGVGKGPLRSLEKLNWQVNRIRADMRALNNKEYGNRGAEIWFNLRRYIEEGNLNIKTFTDSNKELGILLRDQVTRRHYRLRAGKLVLYGKKEEKSQGIQSPDIADALCFALSDLSVGDFADAGEVKVKTDKKHIMTSHEDLQRYMYERTFGNPEDIVSVSVASDVQRDTCVFGSISALLKVQVPQHSYGKPIAFSKSKHRL